MCVCWKGSADDTHKEGTVVRRREEVRRLATLDLQGWPQQLVLFIYFLAKGKNGLAEIDVCLWRKWGHVITMFFVHIEE